jgi:hypothetical protein
MKGSTLNPFDPEFRAALFIAIGISREQGSTRGHGEEPGCSSSSIPFRGGEVRKKMVVDDPPVAELSR